MSVAVWMTAVPEPASLSPELRCGEQDCDPQRHQREPQDEAPHVDARLAVDQFVPLLEVPADLVEENRLLSQRHHGGRYLLEVRGRVFEALRPILEHRAICRLRRLRELVALLQRRAEICHERRPERVDSLAQGGGIRGRVPDFALLAQQREEIGGERQDATVVGPACGCRRDGGRWSSA